MKKLFLIFCLSAATINAMEQEIIEQDLQQLYSLQTIQKWETKLNRINALLSEDLKARNTQDPEINVPLEQVNGVDGIIMTHLKQDIARWRQYKDTPEGQSVLNSLSPQDAEAMLATFGRTMRTFTMVELKYRALLRGGLIKTGQGLSNQARINQEKSDEALRANILPIACIGAGCGLIIGAIYTYATSQHQ